MLSHDALAKLRAFHIPGFIAALKEQYDTPNTYRDIAFEDRLTLLIDAEASRRSDSKIQAKLKASLLLSQVTLDQIDFNPTRGIKKSSTLELVKADWIKAGHHLIITGPTGVGKTFLASAIGTTLCRKNMSVKYMRAHEWIAELISARQLGMYSKLKKKIASFELIIIDEWLREPISQAHARELLDLFDDRYRSRSCLFISQLPVTAWHSSIADPTMADAILDRIVHDAIRIVLSGESMRKAKSLVSNGGEPSLRSDFS